MDSNESPAKDSKEARDAKRQQFTNKQRMDMYAFCVLELEMHSNKVSIKKQQQAIQKVLSETRKDQQTPMLPIMPPPPPAQEQPQSQQPQQHQNQVQLQLQLPTTSTDAATTTTTTTTIFAPTPPPGQQIAYVVVSPQQNGESSLVTNNNNYNNCTEGKTLLQLQQEVAMTRKCYSDYQKTQVLTSSMLRDVQKRFSKYYPDAAIPSRSTIKHVFEKCVNHGTVENIKTPRKPTKIPQGDEIEYLLVHEPQLSLRQLAQKLNVSTGTVSRRCKALGLVPESVTLKHQQIAAARRQKQIKQLEDSKQQIATVPENTNDLNHDSKKPTRANNNSPEGPF